MPSYSTQSRGNPIKSAQSSALRLFNRYLSVVFADTDELRDQVYRLRYRVYCIDREFENAADHPDGREHDADDPRSLHYLALDRTSGRAVGTVRLILPRLDNDLPAVKMIGRSGRRPPHLPLATTAEVSRFAVDKVFRRQLETRWCSAAGSPTRRSGADEPPLPLVTYGLIQAVLLLNSTNNITHVVALMAPGLLRLLRRLGVEFQSIGAPVQHHGWRQPGWASVAQLLDRVRDCRREFREFAPAIGASGFSAAF